MTEVIKKEGRESVLAWLEGVKPEHISLVKRIDALIYEVIPDIACTTKWHKPSQPLGVPFYGIQDRGWILAMWSFKDRVGLGFIAGTLLSPEPPMASMAGPWNRGSEVKARRIDIHDASELDEAQVRSWLTQAYSLPGWGKVEVHGS